MVENRCKNTLQSKLNSFTSIEQALAYFEISFDSTFVSEYGKALSKRFAGNLILTKADDWFSARRALKNAYCKIQRSRLAKGSRSACRGCTSCERR